MSCERFHDWILDDLAGELSAADRRALEEHLEGCDECATLAGDYRRIWEDLPGSLTRHSPVRGLAELQAKVAAEFGSESAPSAARRTSTGWRLYSRRAALVVLLIGIGMVAGLSFERQADTGDAGKEAPSPATGVQPEVDELPRFALLFYEVEGDAARQIQASAETGTWARGLYRQGVVLDGAEMTAEAAWTGPPDVDPRHDSRITHVITIRARDLDQAREIAASAPVAGYGGVVEVRQLEP